MTARIPFNKITPLKVAQLLTHLTCLTLLFLLPVIFASISHGDHRHMAFDMYIKAIIWVCVFYASYYGTTDPTTGKPHAILKFVMQTILIICSAIAALSLIRCLHMCPADLPKPPPHEPPRINAPALHNLMVIILTVALGQAIKFIYKTFHNQETQRERLTRERENELRNLKAQIKPHFLFNSLNTIYALIDIDPTKAKTATHSLSKMLRYTINEASAPVTLGEELQFIRNYIELIRLRLPASTDIIININPGEHENTHIQPLLFINIIENTFKHGIFPSAPGPIKISITATHNTVTCTTANPYDPSYHNSESNGTGLRNLKRRLSLLYPGKHHISIGPQGNRFIVKMTITLDPKNETSNSENIPPQKSYQS